LPHFGAENRTEPDPQTLAPDKSHKNKLKNRYVSH
jgi:hypothetical protein